MESKAGITFQPSLKENQQQKATKTPVTLQKPIHNNYTAHGKKSLESKPEMPYFHGFFPSSFVHFKKVGWVTLSLDAAVRAEISPVCHIKKHSR